VFASLNSTRSKVWPPSVERKMPRSCSGRRDGRARRRRGGSVLGSIGNLRDLLRVAQAEVRPVCAGVRRLVDAVADGQVGPRQAFAAADVDDVRIGRRHGDPADRAGWLIVEDSASTSGRRRWFSRRRRSPSRCRRCYGLAGVTSAAALVRPHDGADVAPRASRRRGWD
jgi:hypothetical protein